MRIQHRTRKGRKVGQGYLLPSVYARVLATAQHCGCSISWVINVACADAMGLELMPAERPEWLVGQKRGRKHA